MKNVIQFELKRQAKSLVVWSIVVSFLIVFLMMFFPLLQNSPLKDIMKAKMDTLPESMKQSLDLEQLTDFSSIGTYFAYVYQNVLMALCLFATMAGTNSLVKEEGEGTIEFLYAQPISRSQIVTSKLMAGIIMLALLTLVSGLVSVVSCLIFSPPGANLVKTMQQILLIISSAFLSGWVYLSLGALLSASIKTATQSTAAFFGLFFLTYFAGMFSDLIKQLEFLQYVSPYKYADPADLIKTGYNLGFILISMALIGISIFFTYRFYKIRDLKI
jgi:ABC-2 type transport system permease protein